MNPYSSTILPNGLTLLTRYDSTMPVVAANLVVKAGYRYEDESDLGYAHILEHMLLKGTKKYPSPSLFAEQIEGVGGNRNGTTNIFFAWYEMNGANEYAELMLDLLAQLRFEPVLDPLLLENEKKPITEELRRAESDNAQFLVRCAEREFFKGHPLGRSFLDSEPAMKNATIEKLKPYLERLYTPERCAIVVCGGITHERAKALTESFFGDWKKGTEDISDRTPFTPQHRAHLHIERPISQTMIDLRYHVPGADTPEESAALQIIATYLAYGSASQLPIRLRQERGLIYGVHAGTYYLPDTGVFFVSTASVKPNETIELTRTIVENIPSHFSADKLDAIKKQRIGVDKLFYLTPRSQADFLSRNFARHGRMVTPDDVQELIEKVTYDDIVRVANKYLRRDNSLLVTLGPNDPGDI